MGEILIEIALWITIDRKFNQNFIIFLQRLYQFFCLSLTQSYFYQLTCLYCTWHDCKIACGVSNWNELLLYRGQSWLFCHCTYIPVMGASAKFNSQTILIDDILTLPTLFPRCWLVVSMSYPSDCQEANYCYYCQSVFHLSYFCCFFLRGIQLHTRNTNITLQSIIIPSCGAWLSAWCKQAHCPMISKKLNPHVPAAYIR